MILGANWLVPGVVRFALGVAVGVMGPMLWFQISQQLKSGKARTGIRLFDRERQTVDFWVTIAIECVASVGFVVLGVAILLGVTPAKPRRAPARVESTRPKVDGLILPTPRQTMPGSPKKPPAVEQPPTTPRAP